MEVKIGKYAGFCFGVKKAIEKTEAEINNSNNEKIYTLGPLIHNELVIQKLKEKGVVVLEKEDEAESINNATVIIRSHGVGPKIYEVLEKNNCKIVDATCPFVKKIHNIVRDASKNGDYIIVVGNKIHPEIRGIVGYVSNDYEVIENVDDAVKFDKNIDKNRKITIVSQTTFNAKDYKKIIDIISKKYYNICVFTTICNSTEERQKEVEEFSKQCSKMLVLGSKTSQNTKKLFDISMKNCEHTFLIDSMSELTKINFNTSDVIGVCAGASTPNDFIGEVVKYARSKF